jgi:ABC-type uncharacterized transport system substrate-binding protein
VSGTAEIRENRPLEKGTFPEGLRVGEQHANPAISARTTITKDGLFAMNHSDRTYGAVSRISPVLLALFVTACATMEPVPEGRPEPEVAEPAPLPGVPPGPPAPAVTEPETFAPRVAVVLSARKPAYENVAKQLGELLEDYAVYDLGDESLTPRQIFAGIEAIETEFVIAIGLRAATVARSFSKVPVVFCQVFNIADNKLTSAQVKGVAALPPLALQVGAWKQLNPGLQDIGAIVGSGHDGLIEEAKDAARSGGLTLHHRIAGSDRETLYLFNRLAPDIDGFWLFPDNRILSPAVLREILAYASRHHVQVAAFNPRLLELGATLSAKSVDSDIAATVVDVARRMAKGESDAIPSVTPLNEIDIRRNPVTAKSPELAAADSGEEGPR